MHGQKASGSHMEKQAVIGAGRWRRESQRGRNSEHREDFTSEAERFIPIYRGLPPPLDMPGPR